MVSKLSDQAEQFFQQVLETVLVAIPVDQNHPSVKADIELNEETGTFVGEFKFPLAYGATKVSDHTFLANGYSDLFSIVIRYEMCSNRNRSFLAVEKVSLNFEFTLLLAYALNTNGTKRMSPQLIFTTRVWRA